MSLRLGTAGQVFGVNVDSIGIDTSERGGVLSYTTVSGIQALRYLANPSGSFPIGIQYNDIEFIEHDREPYPKRYRRTDEPLAIVGVITDGEVVTDWIHEVGTIKQGDKAYVGPSGTITNSTAFGRLRIGTFLTPVTSNPRLLTYQGLGSSREKIDPISKQRVFVNNPADRVFVLSPGHAKVRINQSHFGRG
jgi:hypothetical protein